MTAANDHPPTWPVVRRRTPASAADEEPASAADEEPASAADEEPASVTDEEPASAADEEPACWAFEATVLARPSRAADAAPGRSA